eukprot:TRINITY_DN8500_c0_g2_i1.p1 TRINITY_DN8500_c0_g2~~TRINITY_DN8500_c0_g2_i1.p1  ORF type:complete len:265 (-),score=28.06 TRINITY_DN8500_c0_g2_i1:1422-2216(-)
MQEPLSYENLTIPRATRASVAYRDDIPDCANIVRSLKHVRRDQKLLAHVLKLYCAGELLVDAEPGLWLRQLPIYDAVIDCRKSDPFGGLRPVDRAQQKPGLIARVRKSCDLCKLVRSKPSNLRTPFVLVFPKGHNVGLLSGGLDWYCHDSPGFSEASVKGCRVKRYLEAHCPDIRLTDVLAFLDDHMLRAFVAPQDVIMIRDSTSGQWIPHPKVLTVPIGSRFFFPFASVDVPRLVRRLRKPRRKWLFGRNSDLFWRPYTLACS